MRHHHHPRPSAPPCPWNMRLSVGIPKVFAPLSTSFPPTTEPRARTKRDPMRRKIALDTDYQKKLLVFHVAFTSLSCELRLSIRRILVYRNGSYHSHNLTCRMTSYHVLLDVTRHGYGSSYQSLRPYQHRGRNRYVGAEMLDIEAITIKIRATSSA